MEKVNQPAAPPRPSALYVWLVPSEDVLEQPGSWRIRKWDTEPFPEANFALSDSEQIHVVKGPNGGPVAAPCAISGCAVADGMATLKDPGDRAAQCVEGQKLWLWKNFVDGRQEYWAFANPYPTFGGGDPMVIGEPCGYAIFKESTLSPRHRAWTEAEVVAAIKRAKPVGAPPNRAVKGGNDA